MNSEIARTETSSLDSVQPEPISKQGVTLIEHDPPNIVTREHQRTGVTGKRAQSHLNERAWTLETMLARETIVETLDWPLTSPRGTILKTYDVVADLLVQDIISAPFLRFEDFRCTAVNLYFSVAASRFHQGRVLVTYLPSQIPRENVNQAPFDPFKMNSYQHLWLDPTVGGNGVMTLDFMHYKGYLNLLGNDTLGQIYIYVFNQLQAQTGSQPTISIHVSVSFKDPEFKIPRPGGTSFNAARAVKPQSGILGAVVKGMESIVDEITPEKVISDVISILDKPQIPVPAEQVTVKHMGSMNYVVGPEQIEKMIFYPKAQQLTDKEHFDVSNSADTRLSHHICEKWSYLDTINWAATATPGTILWQIPVGPMASTPVGTITPGHEWVPPEMDYFCLGFKHWRGSLKYGFDVVSSNWQEGRLVWTFHPNSSPAPTDYNTSLSQYAASFYIRSADNGGCIQTPFLSDIPWKLIWTGEPTNANPSDEQFRFQDFFSGTLALRVAAPLRAPTTVVSNVDINIFVCGGPDFEICNPSASNRSISIVPTTLFHRSALNAHKASTHVSTPMRDDWDEEEDLWELSSDSSQRDFSKLRLESRRSTRPQSGHYDGPITIKNPPIIKGGATKVRPQSGDGRVNFNMSPLQAHAVCLDPDNALTYDPKVPHFGETFDSILDICKRYSFALDVDTERPEDGLQVARIPISGLFFDQETANLAQIRYIACYRNFRGPLCFKINASLYFEDNKTEVAFDGYVTYDYCTRLPDQYSAQRMFGHRGGSPANIQTAMPLVHFNQDSHAEFEIPFFSPSGTCLLDNFCDKNITLGSSMNYLNGCLLVGIQTNQHLAALSAQIHVSVAFGDETQMGCFMGTPYVTFTVDGSGHSAWPDWWFFSAVAEAPPKPQKRLTNKPQGKK
jgi:hypothetical protein